MQLSRIPGDRLPLLGFGFISEFSANFVNDTIRGEFWVALGRARLKQPLVSRINTSNCYYYYYLLYLYSVKERSSKFVRGVFLYYLSVGQVVPG